MKEAPREGAMWMEGVETNRVRTYRSCAAGFEGEPSQLEVVATFRDPGEQLKEVRVEVIGRDFSEEYIQLDAFHAVLLWQTLGEVLENILTDDQRTWVGIPTRGLKALEVGEKEATDGS